MAINQNRSQIRFIERQKVYIDVKCVEFNV